MQLVLDATALIKLNRSGVLRVVIAHFECLVPDAVYEEVVTEGRRLSYPDANEIGDMLLDHVEVVPVDDRAVEIDRTAGAGDRAILGMLTSHANVVIVSDDRRLLNQVERAGGKHQSPGDVIVALAESQVVPHSQALQALERIRNLIPAQAYQEAREDIRALRGSNEQE